MSMAMLNNVQFTMTQLMPRVASLGVESLVSLRRIEDFLLSKEFEPSENLKILPVPRRRIPLVNPNLACDNTTPPGNNELKPDRASTTDAQIPFVECVNVSASWPDSQSKTLDKITFKCDSPGLVIVCGQVASGKSSMILSLLNELPIKEGKAVIGGSCGYSSQQAWVFNGTVRENIIFGHGYNQKRYRDVLEICALNRDLELLECGEFTYIQENSLSGGQKARVNLARCLYRECDIYFLDDPFSAIDNGVARHIFEEAVVKFLSNKLVFLVTNHTSFFDKGKKMLVLDRGKLMASCSYTELQRMFKEDSKNESRDEVLERLSFLKTDELIDETEGQASGANEGETNRRPLCPIEERSGAPKNQEGESEKVCRSTANREQFNSVAVCTRSNFMDGDKQLTQPAVGCGLPLAEGSIELIGATPKDQNEGTKTTGTKTTSEKAEATSDDSINFGQRLGENEERHLIISQEANRRPVHVDLGVPADKFHKQPEARDQTELTSGRKADGSEHTKAGAHYRTTTRTNDNAVNRCLDEVKTLPNRDHTGGLVGDQFSTSTVNMPADEEASSSKLPGLRVWYKYYTQTSVTRLILIILTFLTTQALFSTVDIYLTVWSLVERNRASVNEITVFNQQQVATFKQNASISQHQANRTHIIQYDLANGTMSSFLLSLSDDCIDCPTDGSSKMDQKIQRVSISPLSLRSSRPPFVLSVNDVFVPMLNLLHTLPEPRVDSKTNTLSSTSNPSNWTEQQYSHQASTITAKEVSKLDAASLADLRLDDDDIFEESESALNVKSIYRPLYLLVCNFTSQHQALTYTILLMALFSCSVITNVLSLTSSNKSAISLYKKLIDNALFTKLAFFDQNPASRLLNRATRDIGIIDEAIPYNANQAYDALLQTAATFIVVTAVDIRLVLPSLIILFIFLIFHSMHVGPTKDIQRLEGISKSPIISHISTTLAGLHTIRASKSEHRFSKLFERNQDAHTSIFLLYLGCNRSTAVVLDSLNATYTAIIAVWAVVSGLNGPSAGLIITSAMLLSGLTQHGVMKLTETESLMTSVERVIEYCSLPQEEDYDRRRSGKRRCKSNGGCGERPKCRTLLNEGCVEYRHVDLYYNRLAKPVLKNISFKIEAGEKVGIIGRTGAGKSSIITTLFRLYDFEGSILIDGIDIRQLGLIELRSAISIIPQTPVLFSTSIRRNLDPLNIYDDFSLWTALEKAHLRETISTLPGKLDFDIGSGGGFSSGQKQLMCLARVLLRQSSLIVMDEATANVDSNTDAIIQATIRQEFKHCTVITIAHRLETILDCDRIMVLDAGRIVDFDTPGQLMAKNNSFFANLTSESLPQSS